MFRQWKHRCKLLIYMDNQSYSVITAARTWLRTPFHHGASVKGHGVDCLHFIAAAYREAGVVSVTDIPSYQWQWNLNRGAETYLEGILRYAHEVESPQPGDIALWKIGRCFSHAAVVIDWPHVIHAVTGYGVVEENVDNAVWLKFDGKRPRQVKFFSYW